MARLLDRPGRFKATPMAWCFKRGAESQSVALVITYKILAQLVDGEWMDWADFEDHEISGFHNIVLKTGATNADGVLRLIEAGVWNGSTILNMMPDTIQCQITVEAGEYKGRQRMELKWVNHIDSTPGINGEDAESVKALDAKYGSEFRALAAQAKKTTVKKPAPPAKSAPKPEPDDDPLAWMDTGEPESAR